MNRAGELRKQTKEELQKDLLELRHEQLDLRIQRSSEQVANTAKFRELRRDIARIKTVLNEKENG